ncbi:MAG: DUF4194 domain-containing protein [Sporichthyaceae bacterium]|nr:DUF4194 domain-containing protein [Sporichthyaceae bacterium]
MSGAAVQRGEPSLSVVVTSLMKGAVYRETHSAVWEHLLKLQAQVRDYVAVLGLALVIDEAEGYAFLRSRPEEDTDEEVAIPRLVPRRSLSFHVSLLLALLRKRLAEFDATSGDTRLVLSRSQIVDMVSIFMPAMSNEARVIEQIDTYLAKAVELGFLRRIGAAEDSFEVRRIIKAFVDAQWLADFDERLAGYALELATEGVHR